MSIPKVPRRVRNPSFEDGAHAFWNVANTVGNLLDWGSYTGEMTDYGFINLSKESNLRRFRDALKVACKVVPRLGTRSGMSLDQIQGEAQCRFDRWVALPKSCVWQHPIEETYAITIPYSFTRPYGDAALVLFNFSGTTDPADQKKRNAMLGSLNVANQTRRKAPDAYQVDTYAAKGSVYGGTFAFAKQYTIGGRDETSQSARGYSLSESDAEIHKIQNTPYLFLEMEYQDRNF